jgi:hypothetical protein
MIDYFLMKHVPDNKSRMMVGFVNLKIKPARSFKKIGLVCVYVCYQRLFVKFCTSCFGKKNLATAELRSCTGSCTAQHSSAQRWAGEVVGSSSVVRSVRSKQRPT